MREYESRRRVATVVLIAAVLVCAFFAALIVKSVDYEVEVTRTSPNTWHIHDPDNEPEKHLGRTCATEGKAIAQVQSVGDDYSDLNVVCVSQEGASSS